VLLGAIGVSWQLASCAAEAPVSIPAPTVDSPKATGNLQTAVLSGGCFWGVQGVYEHVKGVRKVVSGYAGGDKSTANYETVSTGTTGHAESVQITFDPAQLSYGEILHIFFSVVHDPTELNRQGPDTGSQYRSAIDYRDDTQKNIATAYIAQLNKAGVYHRPIVTRVDPLKGFYAAEGYHQDYLEHNPTNPYIAFNDLPKVENLKRVFPDYYSGRPVLVKE
jgi:peptide-methionine (S)-S-oxide reductase